MSRSIHTTTRELARLAATSFGGPDRRRPVLARAREELAQKRRIKAAVARERRRVLRGVGPTPMETIPIVATGAGDCVHHPASPDDVRAVLRLLPAGVLDGLSRVELRLGAEVQRQREAADPGGADPDPFVGRLGYECLPGVFTGRVLGTYHPARASIHLNAYVHHPSTPLREVWEILLRLWALGTLVHEVAHHHDHTRRVARGRWMAHGRERVETYAEDRQHAWTQAVVVPYLRRAYPAEVDRVERWVAHHGGVLLPLETLADDPRGTRKGGRVSLNVVCWPMAQLLRSLVGEVIAGRPLAACRVEFARDLHYREMYDAALASLARVLADEPAHAGALTLRADILEHQGRHDDALATARAVVDGHPDLVDAWEVISDALEALGRWDELRAAADRLVALHGAEGDRWRLADAHLTRARACLRAGDHAAAAAELAVVEGRERLLQRQRQRLAELRADLVAAGAPG